MRRVHYCSVAGLITALGVALLVEVGANVHSPQRQEGTSPAPWLAASSPSDVAPLAAQLAIEHDFGVVRPSVKMSHEFSIKNESEFPWTLKKIHVHCLCTVPGASATVIQPGQTEQYEVAYKAPSKCSDDRRWVMVEFKEHAAPMVRLVVSANVRRPMTAFPPELDLGQMSEAREAQAHVEVQNHSDHDWSSVAVVASEDAPWLSGTAALVRRETGQPVETAPRQVWRVVVRGHTAGLRPGQHHGSLDLTAGAQRGEQATVSVRLGITAPVQVIPAQFFFGRIPLGKPATRKVVVVFARNAVPESPQEISFRCEPSDLVQLAWSRSHGRFWELVATLTPRDGSDAAEGMVEIEFPGERLPKLEIPVHALVQAEAVP